MASRKYGKLAAGLGLINQPDKNFGSLILGAGGVAPINTVAPIISGTAVVGQVLSCTTGTWVGTPVITYGYQWTRNGVNIGGATSANYTLVQADAGNSSNIACVVTATNSKGSASASSNIIAVILDASTAAWVTATAMASGTVINNMNGFQVATKDLVADANKVSLYPMVTDKATNIDRLEQFKFNFYNPVNSDAAFRLAYSGSITAGTNSIQGNGTNGFANTFINPSVRFPTTDFCAFFNSRTNATANDNAFGALNASAQGIAIAPKWSDNNTYIRGFASAEVTTTLVTRTDGFFILKRVGTTITLKRNNTTVATWTVSGDVRPNLNMFLLATNLNGATVNFSGKQYGLFGFWNVGTSDATDTALFNAAQTFLP